MPPKKARRIRAQRGPTTLQGLYQWPVRVVDSLQTDQVRFQNFLIIVDAGTLWTQDFAGWQFDMYGIECVVEELRQRELDVPPLSF